MACYYKAELRGIDAWRNEDGLWTWDNSWLIEEGIFMLEDQLTSRKIAQHLRKMGYLTAHSKGRIRVVDEWPLYEIQDKNTGKPFLALHFDEIAYPEKPE